MDLTSIFVTAIIFVTLYKVIYLFVRRKERMMLIDKLDHINMTPPEFRSNLDAITRDLGAPDDTAEIIGSNKFTTLRWGSAAFGAGLGLLVAQLICNAFRVTMGNDWGHWRDESTIYGSCLLLFLGLAMLVAFIVEYNIRKKS